MSSRSKVSSCIGLRCFSVACLALAAIVVSICTSNVHAFRYGSTYDVVFNAFVVTPNGEPGLEGHVVSNLVFDGIQDLLPLNSSFPETLDGFDLRTMENTLMEPDDPPSVRLSEPIEIVIESMDGGNLVLNEFQAGAFGRVSISVTDLVWGDGISDDAELTNVSLRLVDSFGNERVAKSPAAVSGDGTSLSPWRISYSIPADQFGDDTQKVKLSFDGMVVPEPAFSAMLMGMFLLAAARRKLG